MTPSDALITAFERANGRALVMRAGARPHVILDGGGVRDIGSNEMTPAAIHGLCNELVPEQARLALHTAHHLRHMLTASTGARYVLTVDSGADGMSLRLERDQDHEPVPVEAVELPPPPVSVTEPSSAATMMGPPPMPVPSPVTGAGPSEDAPAREPEASVPVHTQPTAAAMPEYSAPAPKLVPPAFVAPSSAAPATEQPLEDSIEWWITAARAAGATQLYLRAGASPTVRLADGIRPLLDRVLPAGEVLALREQLQRARPGWELRGNVHVWSDGSGVVAHCTIFTDRAGVGLTVRMQASGGLAQVAADLPPFAREICSGFEGLAIVAGPTRRELTPVLAGISTWIAQGRAVHLISIERESEASIDRGMAFVSQRRVDGGQEDMLQAVLAAAAETPDVLVLEDVPSVEVLRCAIEASREGCLVVAGVTARDSVEALQALVRTAPADRQAELATALGAVWKGAFSRRTLPQRTGGRVSVFDTLAAVPSVVQYLVELDFTGIRSVQALRVRGMRTLNDALARVVHRRRVIGRVAAACADRTELAAALRDRRRRLRSAAAQDDWTPISIRAFA